MTLSRRLAAEALGTGLLLAIVVGSGIMGERLAAGNTAVALLANSLATGAGLAALILTFGPVSAHFNPAVTLVEAYRGKLRWSKTPLYIVAQTIGAAIGVALAQSMFGEPFFAVSERVRTGSGQWLGEFVAAFGLLGVIQGAGQTRPSALPFAVAAYITSAYWFTSSTSFANPAVTLARSLTNTFTGIRPADMPGFIAAQLAGAACAALVFPWLLANKES